MDEPEYNEFGVPIVAEKLFLSWVPEYIKEHPGLTAEELVRRFLDEMHDKPELEE